MWCSVQTFDELKAKYSNVINSKRKLSRVNSVQDLISLLKRRDALTDEIQNIILKYKHIEPRQVINASVQDPRTVPIDNQQFSLAHSNSQHHKNMLKLNNIICEKLGSKWKDFARELTISEGNIDSLGAKSQPDAIRWILQYHEDNCDKARWRHDLLKALNNCRRKDLSNEVNLILDRTS